MPNFACSRRRLKPFYVLLIVYVTSFVAVKLKTKAVDGALEVKTSNCLNLKSILFGPQNTTLRNTSHVLLVSQMRSGSSAVSHLLTLSPSTFYTEEPVREFLNEDFVRKEYTRAVLRLLRDILLCDFSSWPDYYARRASGSHAHDLHRLKLCSFDPKMCSNSAFEEALCHSSRVSFLRLVALDLGETLPLLKDTDLNLKVIHLVRDPRGTWASRRRLKTFSDHLEQTFVNVTSMCQRYQRDLDASLSIYGEYPHKYVLVRYEDLSRNVEKKVIQLYDFMGLPYTVFEADRVAAQTLGLYGEDQDPYSLQKNSTVTAFKWRNELSFAQVENIQKSCKDVLKAYGYRIFNSEKELQNERLDVLLPLPVGFRHLDRYANSRLK